MAIAIAAEFPVSFPSRHYVFQWLLALQSRHAVSIDLQRCTLKENPRYFPSNLIFKILKIWAVRYSDSVHYRPFWSDLSDFSPKDLYLGSITMFRKSQRLTSQRGKMWSLAHCALNRICAVALSLLTRWKFHDFFTKSWIKVWRFFFFPLQNSFCWELGEQQRRTKAKL